MRKNAIQGVAAAVHRAQLIFFHPFPNRASMLVRQNMEAAMVAYVVREDPGLKNQDGSPLYWHFRIRANSPEAAEAIARKNAVGPVKAWGYYQPYGPWEVFGLL